MLKLFYNGDIVTMNPKNPTAEGILVEGQKIIGVGKLAELKAMAKDEVQMVDLENHALLPGFIEPHLHIDLAALITGAHYIGGIKYKNSDDVINEIKKAVRSTPKGQFIYCFGLDYLINRDLPKIDRHFLDNITTEHPLVVLIQSMHTIYANSAAIDMVGITKDTPDPRDGHIYHDENGEVTGVMTEQTLSMKFALAWLQSNKINPIKMINDKIVDIRNVGVTTCWTAGSMPILPNYFQIFQSIFSSEVCPLRQDYAVTIPMLESSQFDAYNPVESGDKMKFTGVKFWYDGSPYTGNMFMYENYLNNEIMQDRLLIEKDQPGERLFSEEVFYNSLKKYHDKGFQISVHSQGDRSGKEVVDTFERILKENPREDHRHRIEHCAFMSKREIERCGELGIALSFHPGHIYYYGEALKELVVGAERTERMLPIKTAIENNVKSSLHSDDPMYTANPLQFVSIAVNRKTTSGNVIGKEECISVYDALKCVTIDAAWQQKRDEELGNIVEGKFADFVLLDKNPLKVEKEDIDKIKVITTYLNGIDTREMIEGGN